jgi:hypothetical protein
MTLTNGSNIGLMRNYATVSMDSGHWGASLASRGYARHALEEALLLLPAAPSM